jgi:hypothetical protein
MRGMKITVDAAMRARDVSRPRPEQEEQARQNEAVPGVTGEQRVKQAPGRQADAAAAPGAAPASAGVAASGAVGAAYPTVPADEAAAGTGQTPQAGSGRRRRRHR